MCGLRLLFPLKIRTITSIIYNEVSDIYLLMFLFIQIYHFGRYYFFVNSFKMQNFKTFILEPLLCDSGILLFTLLYIMSSQSLDNLFCAFVQSAISFYDVVKTSYDYLQFFYNVELQGKFKKNGLFFQQCNLFLFLISASFY